MAAAEAISVVRKPRIITYENTRPQPSMRRNHADLAVIGDQRAGASGSA